MPWNSIDKMLLICDREVQRPRDSGNGFTVMVSLLYRSKVAKTGKIRGKVVSSYKRFTLTVNIFIDPPPQAMRRSRSPQRQPA